MGKRIRTLRDSFAFEHFVEGEEDNAKILKERKVALVDKIVADPLTEREVVAAKHLGETRDTRADRHAFALRAQRERSHLFRDPGARADQTHLAEQDIDKLGEFVQRSRAQESAEARDAGVVWQQLASGVALVVHRPEFDDRERLEVAADAGLDKEWVTAQIDSES